VQQPSWLALLAEACGWAGQAAQGRDAVVEALAIMDTTGERYYEAELYRLKGELLLQEVVYLSTADNSIGPKTRSTAPSPHPLEGARPWARLFCTTHSLGWRA